ncbi:hypothetical protein [Clostridium sp. UBA1056]|uniref:hypothetical protein n=1 Tax=unclassified Clostridium TaxID=2614128 RepID=UPI0032165D2F
MKNLKEKFDLGKLASDVLTTAGKEVGEVALEFPSFFFWGEVELPLDVKEKTE